MRYLRSLTRGPKAAEIGVAAIAVYVGCLVLPARAADYETKHLSTGVDVQRVFIDSEGRVAAIFGQPAAGENRSISTPVDPPTKMVAIDLRNGSILGKCDVQGGLSDAIVDETQVVWGQKKGTQLYRLKLDSSPGPVTHEIGKNVSELCLLGPQQFVSLEKSDDGTAAYVVRDRQSLAEVPDHALSKVPVIQYTEAKSITRLGDGMLYTGFRVLNEGDGSTRCFAFGDDRTPVRIAATNNPVHYSKLARFGDKVWHRIRANDYEIWQMYGHDPIHVSSPLARISASHPLFVTPGETKIGYDQIAHFSVELHDLLKGDLLHTIELEPGVKTNGFNQLPSNIPLRLEGESLVLAVWDDVFVTKLPPRYFENAPEPLRMLFPVAPIVDVNKPCTLQLAARGGKPPYHFSLNETDPNDPGPVGGLFNDQWDSMKKPKAVAEKNGEVTIGAPNHLPLTQAVAVSETAGSVSVDLPKIWAGFCQAVAHSHLMFDTSLAPPVHGTLAEDFFCTSPPSAKIFVSVPLQFHVTDESGQTDEVVISVIALAPRAEYKAAFAKGELVRQELNRQRDQRRRGP